MHRFTSTSIALLGVFLLAFVITAPILAQHGSSLRGESATQSKNALNRIRLVIAAEPRAGAQLQRQWFDQIKKLHLGNVRLRQAQSNELPSIEVGKSSSPQYRVVAILTHANKLYLPGRSFARRDVKALEAYLIQVAEEGAEGVTAVRGAFGLTEKQFLKLHAQLSQLIDFQTARRPLDEVVQQIGKHVSMDLEMDQLVERMLAKAKTSEELKGFAYGTGLALLLRAEGLALEPKLEHGKVVLYIVPHDVTKRDKSDAPTVWPIGYKPEKRLRQVLPIMLESLQIRIEGYTLAEAVTALQERIDAPFFYDHALLSLLKIDPKTVQVRYPARKAMYKSILGNILYQAQLKGDVRVDENGKVFFWMSSSRRPK